MVFLKTRWTCFSEKYNKNRRWSRPSGITDLYRCRSAPAGAAEPLHLQNLPLSMSENMTYIRYMTYMLRYMNI
jgi:hypothetical protein